MFRRDGQKLPEHVKLLIQINAQCPKGPVVADGIAGCQRRCAADPDSPDHDHVRVFFDFHGRQQETDHAFIQKQTGLPERGQGWNRQGKGAKIAAGFQNGYLIPPLKGVGEHAAAGACPDNHCGFCW